MFIQKIVCKIFSIIVGKVNKNDVFYNSGLINMSGDLNMGGKELKILNYLWKMEI